MADSTQWGMGLQGHWCVSVFIAIKEVTDIFVETADVKHSTFDTLVWFVLEGKKTVSGVKRGMHGWIFTYYYTDVCLPINAKQKFLQSN